MMDIKDFLFKKEVPKKWIEVILPLAVPKTYTYSVPPALEQKIIIGCRVEVVFGANKKYAGIIKSITENEPPFQTKELLNVIDDAPVVYNNQLKLWKWISDYYMCTEGEVMAAALPAQLRLSSESIVMFNEDYGDDFSGLEDDEYLIAEALLLKKELNLSEIQSVTNTLHAYPIVKRLIEKGVCTVYESLRDRYKPKSENYIILNPQFENDESLNTLIPQLERAPRQLELLLAYLHFQKTEGEVKQKELLKKAGASPAQLKGLIDKEIVSVVSRTVDRISAMPKKNDPDFNLSEEQEAALKEIDIAFTQKNICLLFGITSSGKTLLYIKQIEKIISQGKQALYLLPEITLTTQIIRRLQQYFGGNVSIYHSKFNNKERMEIWNKVKTGETKVVIGARSSLFLPFIKLGLVIIDEEQDASFKQQDPAPRYNARDTAIYYASLFNCKVLMGSATPAVESFYNALKGKYGLVTLRKRFGGTHLPEIRIIDLKTVAASKKGKVIISPQLKEAMEKTLKEKKQVILFQNRRGYSPFMLCGTCGYIPKCTKCDVSLTLHKFSNKLHCHYCGSIYSRLISCPACGSVNWKEKNFGTEKVEEEMADQFQDYRISRMDYDAVKGKYAHDTLIKLFEQHRIDILVGTQMVVKGLDFENVMLIGILDADGLLSFADFRVNERAFQLMEQVSGRAGRREQKGEVLIQASKTDHPVLQWVKEHDYESFYENEIRVRQQFNYPPFSRILTIIIKHKDKGTAADAAFALAALLKIYFPDMIGPAEPVINRIRNQYLMEIILKLPPEIKKLEAQKQIVKNNIDLVKAQKKFRSVTFIPDVDPS